MTGVCTAVRIALLAVIAIGLGGILIKRNLLMKVIAMDIMSTGIISLYVLSAWHGGRAPILAAPAAPGTMADPVPQAVIVTAIVIGFSILALLIVSVMQLSRRHYTLDSRRVERRWRR
ncbi:MAG: cation:proton antiporter subunit C [Synergistales bacterium]|nr:cation:proton antiporter subunit C [Synergistales bacterium]